MTGDDRDDRALEAFFDAARRTPPAPDDTLLARVMADAASVQAAAQGGAAPQRAAMPRLRDLLGGWPAMAGLATAALAGLWIGTGVPALPGQVTGIDDAAYLVDITPEMAFDLAAGEAR